MIARILTVAAGFAAGYWLAEAMAQKRREREFQSRPTTQSDMDRQFRNWLAAAAERDHPQIRVVTDR